MSFSSKTIRLKFLTSMVYRKSRVEYGRLKKRVIMFFNLGQLDI
jgi:hypothetical protein